jgi:hypothetical protein
MSGYGAGQPNPTEKSQGGEKVRLLSFAPATSTIAHITPHQVLRVIPELVRQILRGVSKVEDAGFQRAIIATDHGFILLHEQMAGDVDKQARQLAH